MRVALDTTYILGRGAVKDTYNLLSDGIVKLMRALATVGDVPVRSRAETHGYQRYVGSSVKGEAAIDWSDRRARRRLLAQIVADADRLLELARQAQDGLDGDSQERQAIVDAAEMLGQLLLQDVQRVGDGDSAGDDADDADGGVSLKDGVSKDRTVSVHDPEMRHGHQSSRRRFGGQCLGQHGRVGPGGTERGQRRRAGGGGHGRYSPRRRRRPPGLHRRWPQAGGPSARPTQQQALPQR